MELITPQTELDAVNTMLAAVGEMSVNTLDVIGNADVSTAIATLRAVIRELQSPGLWFNTDDNYTFTLSVDGTITPPPDMLSMRPVAGRNTARIVTRRGKLWNLSDSTDVFDEAPTARVVWLLEYADLPATVQRYVAVRAGRIFQANYLGSDTLHGYTSEHENEAHALMVDEAHAYEYAAGANFFNDDQDTQAIAGGASGE